MIKKTGILILCVLISVMTFASCGKTETKTVTGGELITKSREAYANLNSAKVIMTNTKTNTVEQTFIFKYDEKDVLMYSYVGKSENSDYAEYNNGAESYSKQNGKITHLVKGDTGYNKYTRELKHPQADKGLIIFDADNVTKATQTEENGVTHVKHIYNAESIGAKLEKGTATGFYADYYFDKSGNLLYFVETTEGTADGKKVEYSYKVEITEKNSVDRIDNPLH